jgi:hypothetical protein
MKIFISIANSDYVTVTSSALTFMSGQSSNNMSTQCTDLVILNDDILEYDENFMIQLSSRSDEVIITAAGEQAEVVIREDSADCKLITEESVFLILKGERTCGLKSREVPMDGNFPGHYSNADCKLPIFLTSKECVVQPHLLRVMPWLP